MKQTSKLMQNSNYKSLFNKKSKSGDILSSSELNLLVFDRKSENQELYSSFDEYVSTYSTKFTGDSLVRKVLDMLILRNKIVVGVIPNSNKIPIFSSVILSDNNNKITNIVVNVDDIRFDLFTKEFEKISDAIYAIYLGFIKGLVIINKREIIKDKEIEDIVITFMKSNMSRILKHYVVLDNKIKEDLFAFAINYFVKLFFFDKRHPLSKEESLETINNKDVALLIKKIDFDRYIEFKSIFSFFVDSKLSFSDTNTLLKVFISSSGLFSYIHMTSDYIFYLIPFIILSKYNFTPIKSIYNYDVSIIDKLEASVVTKYIDKVEFEN